MSRHVIAGLSLTAGCSAFVVPAGAQSALSGSPIIIARAAGRITIDGDLPTP